MPKLVLLLGSNIGDRKHNLQAAVEELEKKTGQLKLKSSLYKTQAWGNTQQDDFYNLALLLETKKEPLNVLEDCIAIEKTLGRMRTEITWQPRTIDIDILFYDDQVINKPDLKVPHPQLALRKFALAPLAEILPGLMHPVYHKSMMQLLLDCPDTLNCESIGSL
jgi:2-amino-4-hydroxy-6-hydroxymethyldihydropteridine diphosphokinase